MTSFVLLLLQAPPGSEAGTDPARGLPTWQPVTPGPGHEGPLSLSLQRFRRGAASRFAFPDDAGWWAFRHGLLGAHTPASVRSPFTPPRLCPLGWGFLPAERRVGRLCVY